MLSVVSIKRGLRQEGPNIGIPTIFVTLGGYADKIPTEDIVETILMMSVKNTWVTIRGQDEDVLSMGIGVLVKGLSSLKRFIEVETNGLLRTPSWTHTVDRWVVDWCVDGAFNLGALRATDALKFTGPLEELDAFLEVSKGYPTIKYLVAPHQEQDRVLDIASKYERVRVYLC